MTQLIDRHTRGVYVIAATPFSEDGALDLASADRMVDFYMGTGVNGMTILGVLGEAPKLAPEEALEFARRTISRARVPVIVGVSAPGLDAMRRLAHEAMAMGAAGVMVQPLPAHTTEAKVKAYFGQVCAALGPEVPVCYQDYPQLTNVHVSVETLLALTSDHPQLVMLKHEDWPGLSKLEQVRAGSGTGDVPRISILCGNSGLFLPQEMARGADGAMTGYCYPEMMVQVVDASTKGDRDRAEDIFDVHLPMVRYEQQPGLGLAVRKEVLRRRGAIACARLRAPGPALSAADHDDIGRLMARLERRLGELG